MALIIVAGDKGSPGVTTAAVALAAAWPRHAILAECDPHGGDLVYRLAAEQGGPLDPNTGLLSVAIAARRGFDARAIPQHLQRVHGGLDVLVGLGTAEQAGAVAGQWSRLARAFDQFAALPEGGDVIADCGRVGPSSPALELMPHAALVLLIARADAEQVAHVRDRANGLSQQLHGNQGASASIARPPIGVVLIAKHREAKRVAHQVGDLLSATAGGAEVLGVLAEDPEGAAALCGRVHARVDKSLLMRSARDLANSVATRYALLRQQPLAAAHTSGSAAQTPRASASGDGPAASPAAAQSYQYPSAHAAASSAAPPPSAAETTAPMLPIRDAYAPPVAPIYSAPQPRSTDQQSYQYSQRAQSQYGQQSAQSQPQHQSRYPQYTQQAQQAQESQQAQNPQYSQSAAQYYQAQAQPQDQPQAQAQPQAQPENQAQHQAQYQAQNHATYQAPAAGQTPATVTLTPKPQPQQSQPQQPQQPEPQSQPGPADVWPIQDAVPTAAASTATPAPESASAPRAEPQLEPQSQPEPSPEPAAAPEPASFAADPADPADPAETPAVPEPSSTSDPSVADLADAEPVSTVSTVSVHSGTVQP
jgi:hypothetical protein